VLQPRTGTYNSRIVRDASGLAIDGREAFMASLTMAEYARGDYTTPDDLGRRVWALFIVGAELLRGKGCNPRKRWELKDALRKATLTCKRKPASKKPRKGRFLNPVAHLNSWRKPEVWTRVARERLMAAMLQQFTTTSVLIVARVMTDAIDLATGFCTLPVADIAKRSGCSVRSVKRARVVLVKSGHWMAGPGAFIPVVPLSHTQAIENNEPKAVSVPTGWPLLYRRVGVYAAEGEAEAFNHLFRPVAANDNQKSNFTRPPTAANSNLVPFPRLGRPHQ
jgi:hypothetical protein